MNNGKLVDNQTVECEVCHQKRIEGHLYRFYYGKKIDPSIFDFLLTLRGYGNPPLLTGHGSAWICRKCVNIRKWLRYGILIIILLSLALLFLAPYMGMQINSLWPPILLVICGIYFVTVPPKKESELAERLSIKIKKKSLKKQGYNVFLTNAQFAKLR